MPVTTLCAGDTFTVGELMDMLTPLNRDHLVRVVIADNEEEAESNLKLIAEMHKHYGEEDARRAYIAVIRHINRRPT